MSNFETHLKTKEKITLVDNFSQEEYTGTISSITHDIVSLIHVKGFKGTAIFMMNQFNVKA